MNKPDMIIAETLGCRKITSHSEADSLSLEPQFDKDQVSEYETRIDGDLYCASHAYLIDLFREFEIPIVGPGCFERGFKAGFREALSEGNKLVIVGKNRTAEVNELANNRFSVYNIK